MVFSGAGNRTFLQGYLTCDLDLLGDAAGTESLLGAACDMNGRVRASMIAGDASGFAGTGGGVNKADLPTWLLLPAEVVDPLLELWGKFLPLYRTVSVSRHYRSPADFSIELGENKSGSKSGDARYKLLDLGATLVLINGGDGSGDKTAGTNMDANAAADENSNSGEGGDGSANSPGGDKDSEAGICLDADSWNAFLVEKHLAFVRGTSTDLMTPQMLNYDELDGISFSKGCYLGQEIVARVHYKGKSSRACQPVSASYIEGMEGTDDIAGTEYDGAPIYSVVQDKKTEAGKLINYYIKEEQGKQTVRGIALLNRNLVDRQNLFIHDQAVKLENS